MFSASITVLRIQIEGFISKCKRKEGRRKEGKKGGRRRGREGRREERREEREGRLGQKCLTTRPDFFIPLLPKFHNPCPWATLTIALFWKNYLRTRYLVKLILCFPFPDYLLFTMCYSAELND